MKRKNIVLSILFSLVLLNCLKAERSPFDVSSPNSTGLGFIIGVGLLNSLQLVGYFVSSSGDDANEGNSSSLPKRTIQAAITAATPPAKIYIAAGNYDVDSGLGTHIVLIEGISLYGGYAQDFSSRDITNNITRITDIATSTGSARAIFAASTITTSTIIDGLSIFGSSDNANTDAIAIFCNGSPTINNNIISGGTVTSATYIEAIYNNAASPIISGNTILGGSSGAGPTFGIFNENGSSPSIVNNTIQGGSAPASSAHAIYNAIGTANNPIITGNTIYGGSGGISYAINTSSPSDSTVINNTLDGGIGNTAYGVYHNGTSGSGANLGDYQSNSIFTSGGVSRYCFFEVGSGGGASSPVVFNNNRLFNCPTAIYVDEAFTNINLISTINGGTTNGASYTGNYQ